MNEFSRRNRARCEAVNGFNHRLADWSLSDWITATLGELGEAANVVKKLNRIRDDIPGNEESVDQLWPMLADELADTMIYLDLLIQAAGFDPDLIRDEKFARTSAKIGYEAPWGVLPT
jgi:NTP pyrophosphatase (non-canonical NTP hydrolase)